MQEFPCRLMAWISQNFIGRAGFHNQPFVQTADRPGNGPNEGWGMTHNNHSLSLLGKFHQQSCNFSSAAGIEGTRRFIEQNQPRLHGQCPSDGNSLLLTSRERFRTCVGLILQSNPGQKFTRFGDCFLSRTLKHMNWCFGDVLQNGAMREQVTFLEDHADSLANPEQRSVTFSTRSRRKHGVFHTHFTTIVTFESVDDP